MIYDIGHWQASGFRHSDSASKSGARGNFTTITLAGGAANADGLSKDQLADLQLIVKKHIIRTAILSSG